MLITIAVAAAVRDGLAAYGTILRYGKHDKKQTACYSTASLELAVMEGVYAGLRAVNRPSDIKVTTPRGNFPECLRTTPFEHLRRGTEELEKVHSISWGEDSYSPDILLCRTLAEVSIERYLEACELASPALPFLKMVAAVFMLPENMPVHVQRWLSKTDEGESAWGEAVKVAMDRISTL